MIFFKEPNHTYCYECNKFPCLRLRQLEKKYRTKYHMSMIDNLNQIKEKGINYFLKKEAEKWKSSIDGISLGLRNERIEGTIEVSKKAKWLASLNAVFYERRNAVNEKWLRQIIARYGYAGIYTINDQNNIEELLSRVSPEFLAEFAENLIITSDDPVYLKK